MIVVIKYPPKYNGELHVSVVPIATYKHYDVSFTIAKESPHETEREALYRAAKDIIRQLDVERVTRRLNELDSKHVK